MLQPGDLQQRLFTQIKNILPANRSLVDEVAEMLHISVDSAYRRIRGEKPLILDELEILCRQFHISLDTLIGLSSDGYLFKGNLKADTSEAFSDYLDNLHKNFSYFNSFEKRHLYVLIKDLPPFLHFQIPEMAAFKAYFWMKSILHDPRFKGIRFSLDEPLLQPYLSVMERIAELFNRIPMTEIWNNESINSTIRQIGFYQDAGMFSSAREAHLLYEKILYLIDHMELQAEYGQKFKVGSEPGKDSTVYNLYVNELILGDNTYLAELDGRVLTFLNHSVLYYVYTEDARFNQGMNDNLQNLISKSTLISRVGEKERAQFFNRLREKVQVRLKALK